MRRTFRSFPTVRAWRSSIRLPSRTAVQAEPHIAPISDKILPLGRTFVSRSSRIPEEIHRLRPARRWRSINRKSSQQGPFVCSAGCAFRGAKPLWRLSHLNHRAWTRSPRRTSPPPPSTAEGRPPRNLQLVVGFLILLVALQAYPSALWLRSGWRRSAEPAATSPGTEAPASAAAAAAPVEVPAGTDWLRACSDESDRGRAIVHAWKSGSRAARASMPPRQSLLRLHRRLPGCSASMPRFRCAFMKRAS